MRPTRRQLLSISGSIGFYALSGCLFRRRGPAAGTLVIENQREKRHTVTVEVTRTSDDDGDVGRDDQTPDPEPTPLDSYRATYAVDAGADVRERGFITEPGAFYVEASLENGETAGAWIGLYRGSDGSIGADAVFVDIATGYLTVYGAHSD